MEEYRDKYKIKIWQNVFYLFVLNKGAVLPKNNFVIVKNNDLKYTSYYVKYMYITVKYEHNAKIG